MNPIPTNKEPAMYNGEKCLCFQIKSQIMASGIVRDKPTVDTTGDSNRIACSHK